MRVFLLRHGQTDWNVEHRCQGHADVPLNDAGRGQARELAATLAASLDGSRPPVVHASPLARARETADILAAHLGAHVETDDDLRELNHGDFEGRLLRELPPEFMRLWERHASAVRMPNGESMLELQARVRRAFDRITGEPRLAHVLVGHGMAFRALLCDLLGEPLDACHRFAVRNCEPQFVERVNGSWALRSL